MKDVSMPDTGWTECFDVSGVPVLASCPLGGSLVEAAYLDAHNFIGQRLVSISAHNAFLLMLSTSTPEQRPSRSIKNESEFTNFRNGSTTLVDLKGGLSIDFHGPFELLAIRIPRGFLEEFTDKVGSSHFELKPCHNADDIVIRHLGRALIEMFDMPTRQSSVLLVHLFQALVAHLVQHYGSGFHDGSSVLKALTIH